MIGKEACAQDKGVVGGIGTGQREETCETVLLSAGVHDGGCGDTGNCTD